MAAYKQPCFHCGEFIERDARLCPKCGSRSPFGYHCPSCLKEIQKEQTVCSGCGRPLIVVCPICGGQTFAGGDKCDACGKSILIKCENKRCGELQFFANAKCTVCGKAIKTARRQIEVMKGGK